MVDDFRPQQPDQTGEPTNKPDDFQATYEDKPETYVTPTGEPTTLDSTPAETPLVITKKKSGAKKWLLWSVVVLLLAGLGAAAYWFWSEADSAKRELSSAQSQLTQAQADLKKANAEADKADEPVASTPTDKELVKTETEAFLAAAQDNKLVVQDANIKTSGMFAVVTAVIPNSDADGKTVVLEKSKDEWVVIYSGVAGSMAAADKTSLVKDYGVPEALLQ